MKQEKNKSPLPTLLGKKMKTLTLPSTSGETFKVENYEGKKIVLYFYPKDNTSGCTLESQEFNELLPAFKKLNTLVFGVSRDTLKSHDNFKNKFSFNFELLSDSDQSACKKFDVIKEKNMYGKKVMGIERSTFIFDESGTIVGEFRKVKAEGHAKAILDFIKGL